MNGPAVKAWRREARQKLLAARAAIAAPARAVLAQQLIDRLSPVLAGRKQPISFYWPIKAEPDLKPLMRALDDAGVAVCLPVCIKLGEPLRFRPWRNGCKMERGFWDIPVPADPVEVEPKTLIAPIVGFDAAGYRLGYGGGFFDRTLAKFGPAAEAIGIGWSMFRLDTIHPQPHDIRMAAIITEAGVLAGDGAAPASAVCYIEEADARYAGFASDEEIAAVLSNIRAALPPERTGLADYALWSLGGTVPAARELSEAPRAVLKALLPRIRSDALYATLSALTASL